MEDSNILSEKQIFDYFDDSDIEDFGFGDESNQFELDDAVDIDYVGEVDPLEIENLLESAETHVDECEYTQKCDIKWKRQPFKPDVIPFKENPTTNCTQEFPTPYQYFKKYFHDDLFEQFAVHTNQYAEQQNRLSFQSTDPAEMRVLFGLHMLMGCIKLPRVSMYWSQRFNLQMFKSNMTSDRFFQLRNNLHVVNNHEKPTDNNDKFFKVRPVLNAVRNRLLQFEVEEIVSVDEQMIPLKNRLEVKQYVRDKPYPWGVKNFVLCGKSGIPYDFFIYQGTTTELQQTDLKNFGFCATSVLHLANRLESRGHKLFFDNYFSSYPLLEILKKRGINAGGTIRLDRFCKPPLLSDAEMVKRGRGYSDSVVSNDDKIVVVKWQDNKSVHLASNFVGIGDTDTAKRWDKKQKKYVDVNRPDIISQYNNGMGGVDLFDQLISYYRVFIRSKKWTLRVIFHFMDFVVCASWLEYRKDRKKAGIPKNEIKDLLNFRLELVDALIKSGNPTRQVKRGRPKSGHCDQVTLHEIRPCKDIRIDGIDHLPEHDQKNQQTRCKNNHCKGRTFFRCGKCDVHLCITKRKNCFKEFHRN